MRFTKDGNVQVSGIIPFDLLNISTFQSHRAVLTYYNSYYMCTMSVEEYILYKETIIIHSSVVKLS